MILFDRLVLFCFSSLFFCVFLAGCEQDSVGLEINAVNYTNKHIYDFTVNGYGGANVTAYGGGGSFVCCIVIPVKWREDLTVAVRWADNDGNPELYKERIVVVPEYGPDDYGFLTVHFFPDDEIKVLVTTKIITHPDYPYPRSKLK